MLEGLKRWFSRGSASGAGQLRQGELLEWAERRQYVLRPLREVHGFAVDGRLGALPWRLEWGPAQRSYIAGTELRLRAELGLPTDLQALVIDRPLQEALEKAMFEQYVGGVQTRIDDQTPPEMRWLVMYPKVTGPETRLLQDQFVAVGQPATWVRQWLAGPLADALRTAPLVAGRPMVLMAGRGRLTLRTAHGAPDPEDLQAWVRVFEAALREARRVETQSADTSAPSTQPSLWTASAPPEDERPR